MLNELLRIGIDAVYCDTVDLMVDSMRKHLDKGAPGEPSV